jgi:hypothetical protein
MAGEWGNPSYQRQVTGPQSQHCHPTRRGTGTY